jgi:CDP-diacylglycerol--glycerol-3-phosphate 3-phosphatidyltransferase
MNAPLGDRGLSKRQCGRHRRSPWSRSDPALLLFHDPLLPEARVIDLKLKPRIDAQLRPLALHASRVGLRGDRIQWTILAVAAVTSAMLLLLPTALPRLSAVLFLLPAALLVRAVLGIVGELQRGQDDESQPAPNLALRETIDAGAEALLVLPLAAYPGVPIAPVVIMVVLGLLVTITGLAVCARDGKPLRERPREGPMNSSDRALVFGLVGLILALEPGSAPWLPWLLLPAAGLALVTLLRRLTPDSLQLGRRPG